MLLASPHAPAVVIGPPLLIEPRTAFAVSAVSDRSAILGESTPLLATAGGGDGTFSPVAVAMADLNSDGIADLVVANSGNDSVLVYLGLGDGEFTLNGGIVLAAGEQPVGVTLADLNGDGRPDMIVAKQRSDDM